MKILCLKCNRRASHFVGGKLLCKLHARIAELLIARAVPGLRG